MRRLRHPLVRDERGQILVIVAGGMIALLAVAALVLEGGSLVLNRRDAQNAADLASVAGTQQVASTTSNRPVAQSAVFAAVDSSMTSNDCITADNCTWTANFPGGLANLGTVNNRRGHSGRLPGRARRRDKAGRRHHRPCDRVQLLDRIDRSDGQVAKPSSFPAGDAADRGLRLDQPCGRRLRPGSTTPAPRKLRRFPARADLRPDGRQGRARWLRLAVVGRLHSAGALADAICTPSNPAFSLDSPYDSPAHTGD